MACSPEAHEALSTEENRSCINTSTYYVVAWALQGRILFRLPLSTQMNLPYERGGFKVVTRAALR